MGGGGGEREKKEKKKGGKRGVGGATKIDNNNSLVWKALNVLTKIPSLINRINQILKLRRYSIITFSL